MSKEAVVTMCKIGSVLTAAATVITTAVVDTAIKNAAEPMLPKFVVGIGRGFINSSISTSGMAGAIALWNIDKVVDLITE